MKKMSSKKMIVTSIAVVTLAGLAVFVGGKLLIKNDSPAATVTPTPIISATPVASPSVSPEATSDPSENSEATATPSAKPTATPKPSAKPTAVPTAKPTAIPTPTPPPVLCDADGANPNLPCDVLVGNYEGMTMFEGDDAEATQCLAWGEEKNNDPGSTHSRYFCTQARRNDRGIWGSAGMLVY